MQKIAAILGLPFDFCADSFDVSFSSLDVVGSFFPQRVNLGANLGAATITFSLSKPANPLASYALFGRRIYADSPSLIAAEICAEVCERAFAEIAAKIAVLKDFIDCGGLEQMVLDAISYNPRFKKDLRDFLAFEVAGVRENAPQIVESWSFYKKFLAL